MLFMMCNIWLYHVKNILKLIYIILYHIVKLYYIISRLYYVTSHDIIFCELIKQDETPAFCGGFFASIFHAIYVLLYVWYVNMSIFFFFFYKCQ